MTIETVSSAVKPAVCVGCATLAGLSGYIWLMFAMMVMMFIVTMMDIHYMWKRCARRKKMIAKINARRLIHDKPD